MELLSCTDIHNMIQMMLCCSLNNSLLRSSVTGTGVINGKRWALARMYLARLHIIIIIIIKWDSEIIHSTSYAFAITMLISDYM